MRKQIKLLYTNSDGLLNKRDALTLCTNDVKPDILLISEVIPKAQKIPITVKGLEIPGYRNAITNFNPKDLNLGTSGKRGLAIYVKGSLNVMCVKLQNQFSEHLVVEVSLSGSDTLVLVLVYRNRQHIMDQA